MSASIRSTDPNDTSNRYCAAYMVHLKKTSEEVSDVGPGEAAPQSIGIISIRDCVTYGTPFSDALALPAETAERDAILSQELGYMLIPEAWGKGYCTEAVLAMINAYKENTAFWKPYRGLFLYVVVGTANSKSVRVCDRIGIKRRGIHRWEGEHVFLGGELQPPVVEVFGDYLIRPN
jgi:RimJ/RimL family protein N-acetyltransferase